MDFFYAYSSDEDNKESKLTEEFEELRKIIEEIKLLEKEVNVYESFQKIKKIQR